MSPAIKTFVFFFSLLQTKRLLLNQTKAEPIELQLFFSCLNSIFVIKLVAHHANYTIFVTSHNKGSCSGYHYQHKRDQSQHFKQVLLYLSRKTPVVFAGIQQPFVSFTSRELHWHSWEKTKHLSLCSENTTTSFKTFQHLNIETSDTISFTTQWWAIIGASHYRTHFFLSGCRCHWAI